MTIWQNFQLFNQYRSGGNEFTSWVKTYEESWNLIKNDYPNFLTLPNLIGPFTKQDNLTLLVNNYLGIPRSIFSTQAIGDVYDVATYDVSEYESMPDNEFIWDDFSYKQVAFAWTNHTRVNEYNAMTIQVLENMLSVFLLDTFYLRRPNQLQGTLLYYPSTTPIVPAGWTPDETSISDNTFTLFIILTSLRDYANMQNFWYNLPQPNYMTLIFKIA